MKHVIPLAGLAVVLVVSGCVDQTALGSDVPEPDMAELTDPVPPVIVVSAPPPPPTANTAAEFDTTSAEDRAAALAAPEPAGERALGTTLATLGSPADPGIWMETPLVTEVVMGRVEVVATGKSVSLELRPSGGAPGSGSEISLPAMRLLEVPLTAIQELAVFAG